MLASSASLVEPAFSHQPEYFQTLGPEVVDLNEMAGYVPDPEQRLGLDLIFGVDRRNKSVAFETAVICSRQNLKTGLFKQAALGWMFLTKEELVIWSAHQFSTTQQAHRDLSQLIDGCSYLSKRVKQIYNSGAYTAIELMSGARTVFKARTKTGGRGLSGNKVILDEGFALQPSQMGALLPTLSAMPDPQVLYGSSAGMADSDVLRAIRDRGRSGISARLAYLEWCAKPGGCQVEQCDHEVGTPGCALDDLDNLKSANPLLGRVRANGTGLTLEYLQAERQALTPAEYGRERLGWWDEPGASEIFGAGKWEACGAATPDGVQLEVVAIAVSVDLAHAAVVGAGQLGERVYAQILAHGPGFDWVKGMLPAGVKVLIDGKGPGKVLVPSLTGVDLEVLDAGDVLDAFAGFFTLVVEGDFLHDRDPLLTAAANGAVVREVSDRAAWGRRKSTSDITPLEGATLAAWWVTLPSVSQPLPPADPQVVQAPTDRNDLRTLGF